MVAYKPPGYYPYDCLHMEELDCTAWFAKPAVAFDWDDALAKSVYSPKHRHFDYSDSLEKVLVHSSLAKVASDAMAEFLTDLLAMNGASVNLDTCVDHAVKGEKYFTGMPLDMQVELFRRMRGKVLAARGIIEKDISITYSDQKCQLSQFVVDQQSNYDDVAAVVTELEAAAIDKDAIRKAVTASSTAKAELAVPGAAAEVVRYVRSLALLLRALEPARRRAAGAPNAVAQWLWREGKITTSEVLSRDGAYAVMSHKGAASKMKSGNLGDVSVEAAKLHRKSKIGAILANLIYETSYGEEAKPHDRKSEYDMAELAKAVMYWLERYESTREKAKKARKDFAKTNPNARSVENLVSFMKVHDANYYNNWRRDHDDAPWKAVLRHYHREEGPKLTPELEAASENLKKLFKGLIITDYERWK